MALSKTATVENAADDSDDQVQQIMAAPTQKLLPMMMHVAQQRLKDPFVIIFVTVISLIIGRILWDLTRLYSLMRRNAAKRSKPRDAIVKLPRLRRDFRLEELHVFDGTQPSGRVLIAVHGNVYDVTSCKHTYGPGGRYSCFGGRDATRALAKFSVDLVNNGDKYDDLSDLTVKEMESVLEWELQFKEKYNLVGKLLRDDEPHTNYDDEDDEQDEQKLIEEVTSLDATFTISNGVKNREIDNIVDQMDVNKNEKDLKDK